MLYRRALYLCFTVTDKQAFFVLSSRNVFLHLLNVIYVIHRHYIGQKDVDPQYEPTCSSAVQVIVVLE